MIRKHGVLAGILLLGAAGIVLLRVFDPAQGGIFPPCPVHYVTGWYCPGCGSLRAMHALLHGNFWQAWSMNPLAIVMLPFIVYGLSSEVCMHFRGRPLRGITLPAVSIRMLCAIIVLFGVARNLPLYPFNLLAPGALSHLP